MAISFVSAASNAGNTITFGTHAAGDLILIGVVREGINPTGTITIPSGWAIVRVGSSASSFLVAYRHASTSSEVSGTWTNATHIVAAVYRGDNLVTVAQSNNTGNNNTAPGYLTWPSTSNSNVTNRWTVGFGVTATSGVGIGTAPAVLTNRVTLISTDDLAIHDSNGNIDWQAQSAANRGTTLSSSSGWTTTSVELIESSWKPSSGGLFVAGGLTGGMRG